MITRGGSESLQATNSIGFMSSMDHEQQHQQFQEKKEKNNNFLGENHGFAEFFAMEVFLYEWIPNVIPTHISLIQVHSIGYSRQDSVSKRVQRYANVANVAPKAPQTSPWRAFAVFAILPFT